MKILEARVLRSAKQIAQKITLVMLLALPILLLLNVLPAKADNTPPSVIINEIMYNPGSDQTKEFLELYNTTGSDIDLNGWCFTAGITGCFTSGMTIAAHGYAVVSPNATQTQTTYGVTTLLTYTGALSNGGERVTLSDNASTLINTVNYSNNAPWPTTPAGTGPSLELKDPTLAITDTSTASSWAASSGGATPGAANSAYLSNSLSINSLTQATNVSPSATPTITASSPLATSMSLIYKVNFDSEQTITMQDDGAHGDGAAGDHVFGASIPAQAAGQLVRYKASATNGSTTVTSPGTSDTIHYLGYAVQNSGVTTNLPLFQWFIAPADYTDMVTNHTEDQQQFDTVLVSGDNVYDNSKVNVYGGSTTQYPKVSLEFELPAGYKIKVPGKMQDGVKEFQLEADTQNIPAVLDPIAWKIVKDIGIPAPQSFAVRVQKNSAFHGLFTFVEKYNKDWRQSHNKESGALYKQTYQKKNPDDGDNTDMLLFQNALSVPRDSARRDYLLDNVDIPNTINVATFEAIVHNHDWATTANMYQYHDTASTGRWSSLLHDLDLTFLSNLAIVTPYDVPSGYETSMRWSFTPMYDEADLREMYFRRLRTLADQYYGGNVLHDLIHDQFTLVGGDLALEFAAWQPGRTVDNSLKELDAKVNKIKQEFLVRYQKSWAIPPAQSSNPVVQISHINTDAGGQDEYIELNNTTDESIDMSGWKIDEIGYTFPGGAVLLAHHTTVIVKNDVAYRGHHPGTYIIGQYANSINGNTSGQLTLKRSDNSEASHASY